jgi:hypothetical protein
LTFLAINLPYTSPPSGWPAVAYAGMLALVGAAFLIRLRPVISGTTLTAPWGWAFISLAAQTAALATQACAAPGGWNAPLGYAAAITSFGPVVAVLGAKRPQDRAWQWIVLTLLIVLALPSGEFLLLRRGTPFTLHAARAWFLAILAAVGWCNYLPTRYWLAATCFFMAQLCQLAAYLPWLLWPQPEWQAWLGLGLFAASAGSACAARLRFASTPWDRLWIDFRDTFGAVWGLRVMERFNAAMRAGNCPVQLTWHGLCAAQLPVTSRMSAAATGVPVPLDPEMLAAVSRNLQPLLRRFVSDRWLAVRIGEQAQLPENE